MNPQAEPHGKPADELPAGYRQGIITALTLFISFSLLFVKYWSLEASGGWTLASACAEALIILAIFLEIMTLWRALQVKDSLLVEYQQNSEVVYGLHICNDHRLVVHHYRRQYSWAGTSALTIM